MKVLVLGAGARIARWVIGMLADDTKIEFTLFLPHARKLHGKVSTNGPVSVLTPFSSRIGDLRRRFRLYLREKLGPATAASPSWQ